MTLRKAGGERLQKVLARAGIASRRAAEQLIAAGRVRVNGRIESELGVRVDPRARVEVDGRRVIAEPLVYVVLHKPRGVVCTLKDPEGRPTVGEHLRGVSARVVPAGRLDFHTSGALICTNDGEFLAKVAHPRHHVPKEYVAKVQGVVDEAALARMKEQIVIEGRPTRPAEVQVLRVEGDKTWITVRLREGRNRQVRRLGEHAGMPVMRLVRVAHAGITAEGLRPGEWRYLTVDELRELQRQFGVPRKVHAPEPRDAPRAPDRRRSAERRPPERRPPERRPPERRPPERRSASDDRRPVRDDRRPARDDRRPVRDDRRPARDDRRPVRDDRRSARDDRRPVRDDRRPARDGRRPAAKDPRSARPSRFR